EIEIVVAIGHHRARSRDGQCGVIPLGGGALPGRAPLRRARWHRPVRDRTAVRAADRDVGAADIAMRRAIETPVGVEIVDRRAPATGGDEWVEALALEEQRHVGAALISVVLADHAGLRLWIVGLADP